MSLPQKPALKSGSAAAAGTGPGTGAAAAAAAAAAAVPPPHPAAAAAAAAAAVAAPPHPNIRALQTQAPQQIPRGPVQQPLEDRVFTPAVSAVYSTLQIDVLAINPAVSKFISTTFVS
ncbi:uncharacterized protein ACDL77_003718 [Rhynchocyon petersi]